MRILLLWLVASLHCTAVFAQARAFDESYTMHGPDGNDYPNESRFTSIVPAELFEIEHLSGHHFFLSIELKTFEQGTQVHWRQTFDTVEHYERIAEFVAGANEQNLRRLAAEALVSGNAA